MRSSVCLFIILMCVAAGFGLRQFRRSPYFFVQAIDVVWLDANMALSSQAIDENEVKNRINIPLGRLGLFDVDVKEAEKSLRSHEWVSGVKVKRHFPHSLEVLLALRTPKALVQFSKDALRYVDHDGFIFGHPDLKSIANLPVFFGFVGHPNEIRQALLLIDHWDSSPLAKSSSISSVYFEPERGFRMLVDYSFKVDEKNHRQVVDNKFRTMIDLGQEIDGRIGHKLSALSSVIRYLSDRAMPVRQIWAEVDKKIVVKTVRGS